MDYHDLDILKSASSTPYKYVVTGPTHISGKREQIVCTNDLNVAVLALNNTSGGVFYHRKYGPWSQMKD